MTETGMLDGMTEERFQEIVSARSVAAGGQAARHRRRLPCFWPSDLSAYITGAVIDVNGGSHIH